MCQTDEDCIAQCVDGRPDAFRRLVTRYETPLSAYLTRRLGDAEEAAEVAQESFVRAYFDLSKLRKGDAFFSWLIGIAHHVMLETFRRHSRERTLSAADPPDRPLADAPADDTDLAEAVAALPDIYREVTVLRYFGGLTCAEVGKRLGIPIGTVTKRLSRAYQLLREALAPQKSEVS